jgi:hypothetical protein
VKNILQYRHINGGKQTANPDKRACEAVLVHAKKKSKKKSPKKQLTSTARETIHYNHGLALLIVEDYCE